MVTTYPSYLWICFSRCQMGQMGHKVCIVLNYGTILVVVLHVAGEILQVS